MVFDLLRAGRALRMEWLVGDQHRRCDPAGRATWDRGITIVTVLCDYGNALPVEALQPAIPAREERVTRSRLAGRRAAISILPDVYT